MIQPPPDPFLLFGFIKIPALVVALIASCLSILLDIRRHNWATALLAIASGALVAIICTDPLVTFLRAPEAEHVIAATMGIAGRNLVVWVSVTSKNPTAIIDALRGKK